MNARGRKRDKRLPLVDTPAPDPLRFTRISTLQAPSAEREETMPRARTQSGVAATVMGVGTFGTSIFSRFSGARTGEEMSPKYVAVQGPDSVRAAAVPTHEPVRRRTALKFRTGTNAQTLRALRNHTFRRARITEVAENWAVLKEPVSSRGTQTSWQRRAGEPEHPTSTVFGAPLFRLVHLERRPANVDHDGTSWKAVPKDAAEPVNTPASGISSGPALNAQALPPKFFPPQQLQVLSQRVYEMIVDRVRREKERNGK